MPPDFTLAPNQHERRLEQLRAHCELTASVRVFDKLSERERRLKIQLLQQEAEAYEARSSYVKDYGSMCAFGKSVSVKASGRLVMGWGRGWLWHSDGGFSFLASHILNVHTCIALHVLQALELMGRVKDGVDKLKSALQAQRGELVRRMEETSAETAVRALT